MNHEWMARLAGYLAWLTAGMPVGFALFTPGAPRPAPLLPWLAAWLGFGICYSLSLGCSEGREGRLVRITLLALEAIAALAVSRLIPSAFGGVLLVILAAQAAMLFPLAGALAWSVAQSAAYALLMRGPWGASNAAFAGIAYLSFGLFAMMIENARLREQLAREALARTHAELEATQALLVDGSRAAERVRIARELHDLLGHHLTALSLNLEVASHLAQDGARDPVEKARQLTKLLLSDVRATVSEMREEGTFDLARAVRTLALDLPAPVVHLDLPDELKIDDPLKAQVLLRCAQEILTNAARHSGAGNLWLALLRNGKGIALTARDDGRGAPALKAGNGLKGMRERVEAAGGALSIDGGSGGFRVELWLPA